MEGHVSAEKTADLVPITREYLREFYRAYPIETPSDEFVEVQEKLDGWCGALDAWNMVDVDALSVDESRHLDRNMYHNRWQCEEIADRAERIGQHVNGGDKDAADAVRKLALNCADAFEAFQKHQAQRVSELVDSFLPNDMRTRLLQRGRERKEQQYKAAVDDLVRNGGTIRQKFDLYWEQQWERRARLAEVGSASGMWKAVIKFLSGCPEVLLDFAKQINAPLGPTEELRVKYGPQLYNLTAFANHVNVLADGVLQVLSSADDADDAKCTAAKDNINNLLCAVDTYVKEASRYLKFMKTVVSESPFFVSADAIARTHTEGSGKQQPMEQVSLSKGYFHEENICILEDSSTLVWQFTVNRDVEFVIRNEEGLPVYGPQDVKCTGEMEEGVLFKLPRGAYTARFTSKANAFRRATVSFRLCVSAPADAKGEDWSTELINRNKFSNSRLRSREALMTKA
mmetsp:Transcript_12136/g.36993  ORF Transcript_12136/g.36993 Transcript_12136/m.36993 type:complete len:457 (+) Transcript_12136:65-1435(+)